VATWETLPGLLRAIFETSATRSPRVPLSNVKRVFRSQFQVELSETALGHSKLSELFQDPRLAGVCTISHTGIGYVIVPPAGFRRGAAAAPAPEKQRARALCVAPLDMDLIEPAEEGNVGGIARSPPGHCEAVPCLVTPSPCAIGKGGMLHPLQSKPPCHDAGGLGALARHQRPGDDVGAVARSPPALCEEISCLATPSPGAMGRRPLPTLLRSLRKTPRRCAGVLGAAARQEDGDEKAPMKRYELQPQRLSVWKTFIHFALPPPTPMGALSRPRARSLPRDG